MNRLEQLFEKLHYDKLGGLFYLNKKEEWLDSFPYRIGRIISDVLKPYAFLHLFHVNNNVESSILNAPFILFFDNPSDNEWGNIQKSIFSFGQAIFVVVNREASGLLDIYHGIGLDSSRNLKKLALHETNIGIESFFRPDLWRKFIEPNTKNIKRIDEYLLNNIIDARKILIAHDGLRLPAQIANKLIGRLLFVRYLIDRDVILHGQKFIVGNDKFERRKELNKIIKDKTKLYGFFEYITNRFEGELFPTGQFGSQNVENAEFSLVSDSHLDVLYHLFSCSSFFAGEKYQGYLIQPSLFDTYDFAVIPVEFISNVYQNFIGHEVKDLSLKLSKQKEIKAYYTPSFLVDFVLSQTVEKHLERVENPSCKTLDPACGSGIFLVETLRKLVEKQIKVSGNHSLSSDVLWDLVSKNIYGFDIDDDAIEITTFSIYITLLDYKTPKEIESFKFRKLRGINLFGGRDSDFFRNPHPFHKRNIWNFDVIIGNPPWGKVKASPYKEYIAERNRREILNSQKVIISGDEISQAFMIRASDFASKNTLIAFIVTGKNFYNRETPAKAWREYFLSLFEITRFVDMTSLNHKAAGGRQIFSGAKLSTVVVFYKIANEATCNNTINHITVKYNRFYSSLGCVIIEKNDIKNVQQQYFMPSMGGSDYLWRVFVHGNIHDYHFLKRFQSLYPKLSTFMRQNALIKRGGYKRGDKSINDPINTESYKDWSHLDAKKDFNKQYEIAPQETWEDVCSRFVKHAKADNKYMCGQFPNIEFISGEKLLVKKGVQADNYHPLVCRHNGNLLFSSTVCSIVSKNKTDKSLLLDYICGVIDGDLFMYYLMNLGASVGIDRSRLNFNEFFSFPVNGAVDVEVANMMKKLNSLKKERSDCDCENWIRQAELDELISGTVSQLKEKTYLTYSLSEKEKALIEYSKDVSLVIFKRKLQSNVFKSIKNSIDDNAFLRKYIHVFFRHFSPKIKGKRFGAEVFISEWYICIKFKIYNDVLSDDIVFNKSSDSVLSSLGFAGMYEISSRLLVQQDIRGFMPDSFYIIKPNERRCWHQAVAYLDLDEFIDAIMKSELKLRGTEQK